MLSLLENAFRIINIECKKTDRLALERIATYCVNNLNEDFELGR
ncbi:Uncharacterised protein [uncultured archaeon]|nr:Uncharacterised protein [uncultured archaeon]